MEALIFPGDGSWLETGMMRRRIGQERLTIGEPEPPHGGAALDEAAALLNWTKPEHLVAGISSAVKGESGWPHLAPLQALLLTAWHNLSDVRLPKASGDIYGDNAFVDARPAVVIRTWYGRRCVAHTES